MLLLLLDISELLHMGTNQRTTTLYSLGLAWMGTGRPCE